MGVIENNSGLKKLGDENVDELSGGYVYKYGDRENYPFEVIDDNNGSVLGRYATLEDAQYAAKNKFGMSEKTIDWYSLKHLRSN